MSINISNSDRAGWSVKRWCGATSISRSKFYTLEGSKKPKSVTVNRRRIITECPTDWLDRVGVA